MVNGFYGMIMDKLRLRVITSMVKNLVSGQTGIHGGGALMS